MFIMYKQELIPEVGVKSPIQSGVQRNTLYSKLN